MKEEKQDNNDDVEDQNQNPNVKIPTDETGVIEMLEEGDGEGSLSEQERNLAIAQAELIGDI
jgi:hypothetical protein